MDIPSRLTPFSRSVLLPALKDSLGRLHRQTQLTLSLPDHPDQPQAIRSHLAEVVLAQWGGEPQAIGRYLGVASPQARARGKASTGIKQTRTWLQDFPSAYARLRRWSEFVFHSEWSQAQLLQVMEEIEPMTAEALSWVHALAVAAVGSYDHLAHQLARKEKDAGRVAAWQLGLVAGLETPEARLLRALQTQTEAASWRERFGHMPVAMEGEMAQPRLGEVGDTWWSRAETIVVWNWNDTRARDRQQDAMQRTMAQAGMLGRSGLRKAIELTQQTLIAHAEARDALAYVVAAARHWAMAAAAEGAEDGRIHHPDEIFMLEIEEIKQMMTGEWHSRGHVESLIHERQKAYQRATTLPSSHDHALGVAGYDTEGPLHILTSPQALRADLPDGFIALAGDWSPQWWEGILRAEGIIDTGGHLLSWSAAAARAGDLPALVGGASWADTREGERIRLDPARHQAQKTL